MSPGPQLRERPAPRATPPRSGRVRRRGPRRSSGPSPKKVLIIGLTTVVVFGGGGYVAYTAVQNANRPPEEQPLTLTELANMFGGGDPFAPDPKADAAKARAAQALRKQALAASREDRRKLDPVVIPTEAPGGNGFDPKAFPPGSNPDPGSNKAIGKELAAARGWSGAEWGCLERLWDRESHWNERAMNRYSGAYGIPQALPGSKMASAGADWQTNPATQIKWGLSYIAGRYGTPCGAWGHFQSRGWY